MLKGSERPTKISEQNIQRFISIYGEILQDEVPDMEVLYNEFNIPLGQARYITQAISYKQTGTFHVIALKHILKSVNEKIGNSEPISIIRIKKTSERVLREIINELSYSDDSIPTPSVAKDLGKYVDYKLRTHDLQAIKDSVTRKLA